MIILDVIGLFVEYWKGITGVSSVLVLVVIGFMKSKVFPDFIKGTIDGVYSWLIGRKKKTVIDEIPIDKAGGIKDTDVLNHSIFSYLDYWLYSMIPAISLRTNFRTIAFRKYLYILVSVYKTQITNFILRGTYKTMDTATLKQVFIQLVLDVNKIAEAEMKIGGIPEIIINKMRIALKDKLNLTIDLIHSICDSNFYESKFNLLKTYSFLNILHSILDNTITNIEPVCNGINGELAGLIIDNVIEPMSKKH